MMTTGTAHTNLESVFLLLVAFGCQRALALASTPAICIQSIGARHWMHRIVFVATENVFVFRFSLFEYAAAAQWPAAGALFSNFILNHVDGGAAAVPGNG